MACGGGIDNTASASGGTPVALGVVSGFGSVYIDGERYDDSAAETAVEDADGPGRAREHRCDGRTAADTLRRRLRDTG
jgi:hypothetical protein